MTFKLCFIERREGSSPSIERVFRAIAAELSAKGIAVQFTKVPFGNSLLGTILNLLFFRPPDADLFHVTGHINYIALRLPRKRTILTIHDLNILERRSGLRLKLIRNLFFTWPVRHAGLVTAISETTKSNLVRRTGLEPHKIYVIDNPLLVMESSENKEFNSLEPTILQLGAYPNKNVDRLVDALKEIPCCLRIVGRIDKALADRIRILGIRVHNDLSLGDLEIDDAYRKADIVAMCSTAEGFGLPIIEAQALGTVVITSDRSPMKDVAGAGAMLVDPESVESIRNGIERIIKDADLRASLIESGRKNVERFRAPRIAEKYLDVYLRILNSSRSTC